ncbi:MAG TPA: iron ABC transporter permease [Actinomycetes bacterium]|nr:iron ABC transporter permease [Actinomycetes bacterium]
MPPLSIASTAAGALPVDSARHEGARLRRRYAVRMALVALLTVLVATLGMTYGQVRVPAGQVWSIIFHHIVGAKTTASPDDSIIWLIRAPRVALGFIVGGALALVGVAVQALVRNPIADPYILGIESGASAAVVIVFYVALVTGSRVFPPAVAAFLGAVATLGLVFALARRRGRVSSTRLLLAGVAVSFALAGITEFFSTLNPDINSTETQQEWTLGSLASAQWDQIPVAFVMLALVAAALRFHSRSLNGLAMGDETSAAVGLDPDRLRIRLLVITSLAVAVVVSLVGPIGFVGLVVPHVGRMVFGAEHTRLLPAVALLGGLYLMAVDLIGRVIFAPDEINVGVLTAIIGAPFFLWLLRRQDIDG